MVAFVRKLSGVKKVGHTGTLDPDATGVLPILIGKATRLADFVTNTTKIYQAEICFGSSTTTYDASGTVTSKNDISSLTLDQIASKMDLFRGQIQQTPPMYSAIKQQGKPLYQLAREGIEVPRKSRPVTIFRLDVKHWQHPILTVEVECSKGTYIRSIAHDLGQAVGCGAHMSSLIRLQSGPFSIDDTISVEQVENACKNNTWDDLVQPCDFALAHLPAITVDEEAKENICHGRHFTAGEQSPTTTEQICRAYSCDGQFLALVNFDAENELWHPKKVFHP